MRPVRTHDFTVPKIDTPQLKSCYNAVTQDNSSNIIISYELVLCLTTLRALINSSILKVGSLQMKHLFRVFIFAVLCY